MSTTHILVVDNEPGMLEVCGDTLTDLPDAEIVLEQDGRAARDKITVKSWDLIITDIRMPIVTGMDLLRAAREKDPDTLVLMITAFPQAETAVESMKLGAVDYLIKPFQPEDLLATCERLLETRRLRDENRFLMRQVEAPHRFHDIIGKSEAMRSVYEKIRLLAHNDIDVLILGETGTGKELVARSLHRAGPRNDQRFVPIDCGAIPEALLESEFFGHERGAFTGAQARNLGLLEFAHGGTVFLDEIAQLPLNLQAKLLRALQSRKIRRVGGHEEIAIDVGIIAATSLNLQEEIRQHRFRADLYYRINVACIEVPPLRERPEDIPLLARFFLETFAREMKREGMDLAPDVCEILLSYQWPGNVRELQNAVKRAGALTPGGLITADNLPDELIAQAGLTAEAREGGFAERRNAFERSYFEELLNRCDGNIARAQSESQLPRATFYRFLKKHGICRHFNKPDKIPAESPAG